MLGQMFGPLIARAGRACTIRVKNGEAYDPSTGRVTYTTADATMTGVVRNYRTDEIGGADSLVQVGDREITVDGAQFGGVLPSTSARIVVDGEEQEVIRRTPILSGDQVVLCTYHVRGTA